MNPTEPGPSGCGNSKSQKRKRGPYKSYLWDKSVPIPRTTLISQQKSRKVESAPCMDKSDVDQDTNLQESNVDVPELHEEINADSDNGSIDHGERSQSERGLEHNQSEAPTEPHIVEDVHEQQPRQQKQPVNYIEKYQLNAPLHHSISTTKLDALLMILHLAVRHCNTQHFIEDQIKFVNVLIGSTVLDISYHIFKNLFKPDVKSRKHYFCPQCEVIVGSEDIHGVQFVKCPKCPAEIDVKSITSGNYFITLSLRSQIEDLLKKPNLKIIPHINRKNDGTIRDICDGESYKKLTEHGFPLSNEDAFTATFNTDGVCIQDSSGQSLFPIFLHLNEICPEQRFKQENLILAGLWYGKGSPNMSMFLKPFLEELIDLSVNGVDYVKSDGSCVKCPVFPLLCSVDSVCKPKVLCKKQFNGLSGCLYCFHPNDSVVDDDYLHRYYDTSTTYATRTEESVVKDMVTADGLQRSNQLKDGSVNGFLGISILLMFIRLKDHFCVNTFNIVWGVVIDYLHCLCEGVACDLFCFFDVLLNRQQLEELDNRLSMITPPQAMTRKPRSFSDRKFWKAKEFRAFLLYYSLPCLQDLIPDKNYQNLKHLVNAVHILLSDEISKAKLLEARSDLEEFCRGFQKLYGLQNVTYNLHLCTHLCDLVEQYGPLYCYSNFIFESGNGFLGRLVRGTKSIINEISEKYSTLKTASKFIIRNNVSPGPLKFCGEMIGFQYTKQYLENSDVYLTGSSSVASVNEDVSRLLTLNNVPVVDQKVTFHNRAIRNGIIFCSKSYSKAKVYDDSCVMLQDGTFAIIDKIVKSVTNDLLCVIFPIRIAEGFDIIPSIRKCSFDAFDEVCIVPFCNIARKCMFVSFQTKHFVCVLPNLYERD